MRYMMIAFALVVQGCFFPEYTFNDNGCDGGGGGKAGASGGTGGTGGCGGTGG